jgi:hypothetical protein
MNELHIYRAGGYIGSKPEERKPMQRSITINEEEWDQADILMPMNVRELMLNQEREKSADEELLEREYIDDATADSNILLPPGVGR